MTRSPRAAAVLMVSYLLLGVSQVFLGRPGSLLWLKVVVVVGFVVFAALYAITLINLRRHPELVGPYRSGASHR